MKNIYYLIWSDSILSFRKYNPKRKDWKVALLFINTWTNALNAWIIFLWLKFFNVFTLPLISINVFPGKLLNYFIAFTIEFALPFGILNYFLIFHKDRYKQIIERYPEPRRCVFLYSTIIALTAFISAILYGILN